MPRARQPKRVYMAVDTFTVSHPYYAVVNADQDAYDAEETAKAEPLPEYLDDEAPDPNDCDTRCDEDSEVQTLHLVKISSLTTKRRRFAQIVPVAPQVLDPTSYQGYPIIANKVRLKIHVYPKAEWQLYQEEDSIQLPCCNSQSEGRTRPKGAHR